MLGHVDHGKSTLIGRLLHDTGSLPEARIAEVIASSKRRGLDHVEWSFALDALQDERDQAITIDTTRVWFSVRDRRYVIIDAPGHEEFLANAMTGASDADAAILVVDAAAGVEEQTRRHAYLLGLLAVGRVIVAINKIDAIGYDAERIAAIERDAIAALQAVGVTPDAIVPISARSGDNIAAVSTNTPWFSGLPLADVLAMFAPEAQPEDAAPLRFWVQDVYRDGDDRVAVGVVRSGRIAVGDRVRIAPAGTNAQVRTLRAWPTDPTEACAGTSVGVVFTTPAFVDRGDLLASIDEPPLVARSLRLRAFWFDSAPPRTGDALRLRAGSADVAVRVVEVHETLDPRTLAAASASAPSRGTVYTLTLRTATPIPVDIGERCAISRGGLPIAAAHAISVETEATQVFPTHHLITRAERTERNGYAGRVLWLTGLPASGKTTVAMGVERELFARGYQVYTLDGDTLRAGLTKDLDFSAEGRAENVRRVAEAAKLFADAGVIVLVSLVSPYAAHREMARALVGDAFREIYVHADIATCSARDPKQLYARARRGELRGFTGVDAPYEVPAAPDAVVESQRDDIEACVAELARYVLDDVRSRALLPTGPAEALGTAAPYL